MTFLSRYISTLFLSISFMSLGACAYMIDKSNQDLTVLTPGAENAYCDVYVDGFRYRFDPPQTRNIFKSKENLVVDCVAPGNRMKKVVYSPTKSDATAFNVANGVVPGGLWDYHSGAMFAYPDVIEVDFSAMPVTPMALPGQNAPDIMQPEKYHLEEIRPGLPRLNSDTDDMNAPILERRKPGTLFDEYGFTGETEGVYGDDSSSGIVGDQTDGGKGDLMNVSPDLNAPSGGEQPVQLFPVQ